MESKSTVQSLIDMGLLSGGLPSPRKVSFSPTAKKRKEVRTTTPKPHRSNPPLHDRDLYQRGMELLKKRQVKAEQLHHSECPFIPHIDRKSIELASPRREPLYNKRENSPEVIQEKNEKKLSPKDLQEFIKRTEDKTRSLKDKLDTKRKEKSEALASDCPFKPALVTKDKPFNKRQISLYELARQKAEKLERLRQASIAMQVEVETKECTFKPQILKSYPVPLTEPQATSEANYLVKWQQKLSALS